MSMTMYLVNTRQEFGFCKGNVISQSRESTSLMATFLLTRIAVHRFLLRSSISICFRPMSFQATVSKLQPAVKELVLSVTRDGKELIGETEADEKEVLGWIEKTGQGNLATENNLKVHTFLPVKLTRLNTTRIWTPSSSLKHISRQTI